MPNKFEATDPRGFRIACSEEAWNHIIGNRPWMDSASWESDIKQTIKNPTMGIYQDADFSDRQIYYLFRVRGKNRYLKVVVEIKGTKTGEVVTAYPTLNAKAGEQMIWPTSKT